MTFCSGCNAKLGFVKYNFQKQWRTPGYYCKTCMTKIGKDWDINGKITIPKQNCDLCHQEFYFLVTTWKNTKPYHCCSVCKDLDCMESSQTVIPSHIPKMMACFASFGILLMVIGFAYVLLVAPQQESSILHIIVGSSMSGAGFMLARKMVKVRNIILNEKTQPSNVNMK